MGTISLRECPPGRACWSRSTFPEICRWQEGQWLHYFIYKDDIPCNRLMPYLCSELDRLRNVGLEVLQVAITEVWPPRTRIAFHRSQRQVRLRLMCPLVVPRNSTSVLL